VSLQTDRSIASLKRLVVFLFACAFCAWLRTAYFLEMTIVVAAVIAVET
jgi:hypothetical protein